MVPNIMTLCIYTLFIWLCTIAGHLCDQCREGAVLTNAAISPNLQKTHLKRVTNARTMSDCTMACCNHSGCDLSWMLGRQCYIVNCQHKESCEPQKVERMQSYLTFVLKPSPRFIPFALYENIPPNREYSLLTDQGDQEEDMTSFKDLSSLIKNPSLEDLTDYTDDYSGPQLDLLHINAKEGDKVSPDLDYLSWILPDFNKNTTTVEIGRRDDDGLELPREESLSKGIVNHVSEATSEDSMSTTTEMALTKPVEITETFVAELPTLLPNSTSEKHFSADVLGKSENKATFQPVLEPQETTEHMNSTVPTNPSIVDNVLSTTVTNNPVSELTVTTAGNIEVTLPTHEVQLNVFVSPEAPPDMPYNYEWKLISQPTDFLGELKMTNTRSPTLSKLTAGLYRLRVSVSRTNMAGEGFVNITVKSATRINLPPIVVVSPKIQEVLAPTSSAYVDASHIINPNFKRKEIVSVQELVNNGDITIKLADKGGMVVLIDTFMYHNEIKRQLEGENVYKKLMGGPKFVFLKSTDDDKIVAYHWEQIEGSSQEMKTRRDNPMLHLSNLVPGNYTFRAEI